MRWPNRDHGYCRTAQVGSPIEYPRLSGFTLVELLAVIAIMALLLAFLVPVIGGLTSSRGVATAAYDVVGAIERARTYAMSNNTYTWVGFFMEDITAPPTEWNPGNGNVGGRLIISVVASRDGTRIVNPGASGQNPLPPDRLVQVGNLIRVENVQLADLPAPNPAGSSEFDRRPDSGGADDTQAYKIGETHPRSFGSTAFSATRFPFTYPVGPGATTPRYTFTRTLRINPQGEVNLQTSYSLAPWIEIGLVQTRSNTRDPQALDNPAAILVNGITAKPMMFRK